MVDPVTPIDASHPTTATDVGSTRAIASDSANAWVAARQARITAGLEQQGAERAEDERQEDWQAERDREDEVAALFGRQSHRDPENHRDPETQAEDGESATDSGRASGAYDDEQGTTEPQPLLSGESARIGTQNFDDDTPFGERVAIV